MRVRHFRRWCWIYQFVEMSLFRALLFWALWFFFISIVRFCLHPHNLADEYQIEMSILPYSLLYFSLRCSTALLLLLLGIFFSVYFSFSLSVVPFSTSYYVYLFISGPSFSVLSAHFHLSLHHHHRRHFILCVCAPFTQCQHHISHNVYNVSSSLYLTLSLSNHQRL